MSVSMILELAIAVISGAGVGWITNFIAVTMLFRKYGRWGGVIEAQYEEFIENMSQLVEDDLVNHKTLRGEFNTPAFRAILHTWIEDILRKELPAKSGSICFEEIPGIQESVARLIGLVRELDPILADTVYSLFEHKELQTIISKEQYEYLVDTNVSAVLSDDAPYQDDLKAILYSFLADRVINTLISHEAIDQIRENINRSIQTIDFSHFDRDIDDGYTALLQFIGIDQIIRDLEQSLGQMRFADFIKDSKHLSKEIISRLIEFSKTPEGQNLLLEIANNLLEDAKSIQLKIGDVVSPAIKTGIVHFIKEKLPGIIDKIADFVNETGDEIEEIINDTIDRHLESSAGSSILKTFKTLFMDDLAKQYNVLGKIIAAIHKHGDTAGSRITNELLAFIEINSIGNLITILQEQNILTSQGMVMLINLNLQDMPKKDYNVIEKVLYTKVGSNFKPDLSKIKTVLFPQIFDKIKQDYLYQDTFKKDIQSKINNKITETVNKTGAAFFSAQKIPLPLKEQSIKNALRSLWNQISVKKINTIIPKKAMEHLRIPWESLWNRHKYRKLNQIYQTIQKDAVYTKTAEEILEIFNQHLDKIVIGNVSKLVNNELKKSSPSQIRVMVQEFMGKELKPINAFGAFLGAIAGGLSVWIAFLLGIPQDFIWWMLPIYGIIFAIVGIATNWLAIKMLFRPYKKILFSASPFMGIVALRKPEFAKSISRFVKERTLNDAALTQFFSKNKSSLQEKNCLWMTDSDYTIIDTLFSDDKKLDRITDFIFSAIQGYSTQHSAVIADFIAKHLKDMTVSGKLDPYLPSLRDGIMQNLQEMDLAFYMYRFIKKESEGKKLGSWFSKYADLQTNYLFEILENELTIERIKQFIYQQNEQFLSYISTHSFDDFAGTQVTAGLVQGISEKTGDVLHTAVSPMVKYFEEKEFNPRTKLDELFGGKLAGFIEKHSTYLLDMISQEISSQKGALIEQIKDTIPWYAAPARGHVAPIVDLLVDEELPKFLKQKKGNILSITNTLLEYRLSDLGISQDMLNIAKIEQAVSKVLHSPNMQQSISHFVRVVVDQYAQVPLKSILAVLNITTIQDLVTIVEPLLNPAISYIKFPLLQDDVSALMVDFMKDLIGKITDSIAILDLLAGIDIEKELDGLVKLLIQDTTVMDAVSSLLMSILLKITKDSNFYSDAILQKDMENFIARKMRQDWESLKLACIPLFKRFFQGLNKTLTAETKQAIWSEYLIPAVLDATETNFNTMIHSIDIQKVVEREVNAMHPREIEILFNKFAGRYFIKITLYGWIGVFGGLLSYIIGYILGWFL